MPDMLKINKTFPFLIWLNHYIFCKIKIHLDLAKFNIDVKQI